MRTDIYIHRQVSKDGAIHREMVRSALHKLSEKHPHPEHFGVSTIHSETMPGEMSLETARRHLEEIAKDPAYSRHSSGSGRGAFVGYRKR